MTLDGALLHRSGGKCELCSAETKLASYEVPESVGQAESTILLCPVCLSQVSSATELDADHWRCLSDSMWSPVPAVQIMAWRQLKRLANASWAQDLLDMLYFDDDMQQWAEAADLSADEAKLPTKDCNGALLQQGDTVTIVKDLDVKGTSFTAKRGTAVRNIGLTDNPEHIEGRVNGTRIVLLTQFVKLA